MAELDYPDKGEQSAESAARAFQEIVSAPVDARPRAKLVQLQWELEYSRKVSWSARPESRGIEQTAPLRALHRFSGTARNDLPDQKRRAQSETWRIHRC